MEIKHELLGQGKKMSYHIILVSLSAVVRNDFFFLGAYEAEVHRTHRNLNAHKFSKVSIHPK